MWMLTPTSTAEQLFFTTLRLEGATPTGSVGGTGFAVLVPVVGADPLMILVTNKHVLDAVTTLRIVGPGASQDRQRPDPGTKAVAIATPPCWVGHPSPAVDVAALALTGLPLVSDRQPFLKALPIDLLLNETQTQQLDAIEPVTFIGYPNALHDTVNMTPIARRGWTATPISLDYNGTPTFLIDASVFPGSSGSPVLILDSGSYAPKGGGLVLGSRAFLVGILGAVYIHTTTGRLAAAPASTLQFDQMMDLGIVYKTLTIVATIDELLKSHGQQRLVPTAPPPEAALPVDPPPNSMPEPPPSEAS